jgi:hypothetical protein
MPASCIFFSSAATSSSSSSSFSPSSSLIALICKHPLHHELVLDLPPQQTLCPHQLGSNTHLLVQNLPPRLRHPWAVALGIQPRHPPSSCNPTPHAQETNPQSRPLTLVQPIQVKPTKTQPASPRHRPREFANVDIDEQSPCYSLLPCSLLAQNPHVDMEACASHRRRPKAQAGKPHAELTKRHRFSRVANDRHDHGTKCTLTLLTQGRHLLSTITLMFSLSWYPDLEQPVCTNLERPVIFSDDEKTEICSWSGYQKRGEKLGSNWG